MIYIYIGIILSYLSFIEIFIRKIQNSKFSFILGLFILLFLSGMRYQVGHDWYAYVGFYTDIQRSSHVEVGYSFLNNLFSNIDISFNGFLFVISFLTLFFIYKTGIRLKYKLIFLFIYFSDLFLYLNLSGMRQGIAIAITIYSIKYIMKKRIDLFLITIFFATLFHFTSIIFVLAYFAYWFDTTTKSNVIIFIIILLMWLNLQNFIEILLTYVSTDGKLFYYLSAHGAGENNLNNYIIGIIKRSLLLVVYFTIPKHLRKDINLDKFIKIYLIGFIIYIFFYVINEDIGVRLSAYFLILDTIIFSMILQTNIHVYHKLSIFILIMMIYFYKLYTFMNVPAYYYKVFL